MTTYRENVLSNPKFYSHHCNRNTNTKKKSTNRDTSSGENNLRWYFCTLCRLCSGPIIHRYMWSTAACLITAANGCRFGQLPVALNPTRRCTQETLKSSSLNLSQPYTQAWMRPSKNMKHLLSDMSVKTLANLGEATTCWTVKRHSLVAALTSVWEIWT